MIHRFFLRARVLSASLVLCWPVLSQSSELRLADALSLAATHHPSVKAKQAELHASQGDLQTAKWSRFPTVSTEVTASTGKPQGALLVQQPLWAGGKIDAQNRLAQANVQLAEAGLREVRNNLLQQTGTQFFEVIRLRQRLEAAQKSEAEHRKLFELIQRRVSSEVSPMADQVLANARLQQAVSERLQFNRSLQAAELALQQSVGAPHSNLKPPKTLGWQRMDETAAIEAAKASSAELLRLRTQEQASLAQIDMAEAAVYPTLALAYKRSLGATDAGTDPSKTYLSLQFSPGPGLSFRSAAAAARSRLENTLQNVVVYERQLEQQVRTARADWDALSQQAEPAQSLVTATDDVVASYLRQYQIGKKNWLDVLNAVRESTQATYNAVDVVAGTLSTQLRLMLYTGQLSADNLLAIHD